MDSNQYYDDLMKKSEDLRQKKALASLVSGIADSLGSTQSAGNFWLGKMGNTANSSDTVSKFAQMAGDPVRNEMQKMAFMDSALKKKQSADMMDPNSDASKSQMAMIQKLIPGADLSGMTGAQMEKALPLLWQKSQKKEDQSFTSSENAKDRYSRSQQAQDKAQADEKKNLTQIELTMQDRWQKNQLTKDTQDVAVSYEKVRNATATPAGDLALVFNYMKMLDPGSVVRESEFKNAEQAKAWLSKTEASGYTVPSMVKTAIQKAESGTFLLPEQRANFKQEAETIFGSQMAQQERFNQNFSNMAKMFGADPNKVVLNELFSVQQKQEAPVENERMAALDWAKKNPDDPRAKKIMGILGTDNSGVAGK